MVTKYVYQQLPLQDTPKLTKIRIFGLKIYHLATLDARQKFRSYATVSHVLPLFVPAAVAAAKPSRIILHMNSGIETWQMWLFAFIPGAEQNNSPFST
jgi:hypothetical protein